MPRHPQALWLPSTVYDAGEAAREVWIAELFAELPPTPVVPWGIVLCAMDDEVAAKWREDVRQAFQGWIKSRYRA